MADLGRLGFGPETGEVTELGEIKRKTVVQMLSRCGWKQADAARLLGISKSTMSRLVSGYGLTDEVKARRTEGSRHRP